MRKLVISLLICLSSFIFINSVKADSGYYFYNNDSVINHYLDKSNFQTIYNSLMNYYEQNKSTYPYYMIYFLKNNGNYQGLIGLFNNDYPTLYLTRVSSYDYNFGFSNVGTRMVYFCNFSNNNCGLWASSSNANLGISSVSSSSPVVNNENLLINYILNYSNTELFFYDSNVPSINITNVPLKDKNGNRLDTLPFYLKKQVDPTIDYSITSNTIDIFDHDFVISKNLTVTVNNFDNAKHLLIYKRTDADNWITHNFVGDNHTLNLTVKDNGTYIFRILDLENNYDVIYSSTYTISGIEDRHILYDMTDLCDLQGRNFVQVTFDLIQVYNPNYKYQYRYDNRQQWIDITDDLIIDSNYDIYRYELDEYFNHQVHFRVLDNNDNVIDTVSVNVGSRTLGQAVDINKSFSDNRIYYDVDFSYFEGLEKYNFNYYVNSSTNGELNYQITSLNNNTHRIAIDTLVNTAYTFDIIVMFDDVEVSRTRVSVSSTTDEKNEILAELLGDDTDSSNLNDLGSMTNVVKNFIQHIGEYTSYITDIVGYFFNKMNVYVKSLVITLFILLIFCAIIKISRK